MDTPQLEAFIAVVEVGSFTRAAARLQLSQPTVTTRIKSLEDALGTMLVERLSSGIRTTAAGADLLPYAREIVGLTGRARHAVNSGGQPHGRIDVGAVESLATYRLLPMIEYLYWRYPKMQVSLHTSSTGNSVADVREGRFDCAFFIGPREEWEGLETAVLGAEPLVLVASPDHWLVGRTDVTTEDLRTATLTRADNNAEYHRLFEESIGMHTASHPPRTFELASVDAVKHSVAQGLGMALLPTVSVQRELALRQLVAIDWDVRVDAYAQVVWRAGRTPNVSLNALVNAAIRIARERNEGAGERTLVEAGA